MILVKGKNIFDEQAVVKEEKKWGQEGDQDNGIGYKISELAKREKYVDDNNQQEIKYHHKENSHTVLQTGVADDAPVATRDENWNKATCSIYQYTVEKMVTVKVFQREIKPKKIPQECRKRNKKKVDENNHPPR